MTLLGGLGWVFWADGGQDSPSTNTPAKQVVAKKPTLKPIRPPSDTITPRSQTLRRPVVPKQTLAEAQRTIIALTDYDKETGYAEEILSVWPVTKAGIDGAVREVMPEIMACYQSWLLDYPDLEGRIKMKFTINDEDGIGQVHNVEATDTLGAEPFTACVANLMANLQFDSPGDAGPVTIHYPFHFQINDDDDR